MTSQQDVELVTSINSIIGYLYDIKPPRNRQTTTLLKSLFSIILNKVDKDRGVNTDYIFNAYMLNCRDTEWRMGARSRFGIEIERNLIRQPIARRTGKRVSLKKLALIKRHAHQLLSLLSHVDTWISDDFQFVAGELRGTPLDACIRMLYMYSGSVHMAESMMWKYITNEASKNRDMKVILDEFINTEKFKLSMNIPCYLNGRLLETQA